MKETKKRSCCVMTILRSAQTLKGRILRHLSSRAYHNKSIGNVKL